MGRKSYAAIQVERERVLSVMLGTSSALSIYKLRDAYLAQTGLTISYQTLRHRLHELEQAGSIQPIDPRRRRLMFRPLTNNTSESSPHASGSGVGAKQTLPTHSTIGPSPSNPPAAEPIGSLKLQSDIPLSDEAHASRAILLRPPAHRKRVTYDPDFLARYTPGLTWYLPEPLRISLRDQGITAFAQQPAGTYAREIMGRLIIDLSWGSSRLEGNRYSRIDTEQLLQHDRTPEGTSDTDRQMILNHKAAIEFLVENADEIAFNRRTVLGLHALLSENLMPNPEDEGQLRIKPVTVGATMYLPTAIPQLIEQEFDQILAKAEQIPDPFEQSFFIMVHLPYLQPFIDVNKRTSRLTANIPLIKANLCPLSFVDVPEEIYTDGTLAVYEQNRVELLRDVFTWAYARSCQAFATIRESMGTPDPIRLKYRLQLRALVGEMVRDRIWPSSGVLREWAMTHNVPNEDRDGFLKAAHQALKGLRSDILARYGLRLSEFDSWVQAIGDVRTTTGGTSPAAR